MLSDTAMTILKQRYLKDDETPDDMFRRVAKNIAKAGGDETGEIAQRYYEMMSRGDFLPNSPALMNAGRELQQLSACFVLPVEDSIEGIFESIKNAALIHKSGGGTGFSFSKLRPAFDNVKTTGGVASGPVSFMKVFNAATEAIKQGGVRRGANMGILRVDHPDILEFITCKSDNDELTNFNISVGITEDFMLAGLEDSEYALRNPRTGEVVRMLDARDVMEKIAHQAWLNGEPGIVFLDKINDDNPTPHLGEIESTNPCGEQPLLPYEACCLGSINLGNFVENGSIDWSRLNEVVSTSVRFLDDLIDANRYPLPEIEKMVRGNRKIGLGVMGWADMLVDLGIPYNSEEALELANNVMCRIYTAAFETSETLGVEKGRYPNAKESKLRNATITTIAPTGTISMIAGASSGIEPYFSIAFTRHVMDTDFIEVNSRFEKIAKERGFYSEALMKKIARQGNLEGMEEVPEDVRKLFVTAHEIAPEWHVKMQAAFQEWIDNAVSKTVNLPHDATQEDVLGVFLLAHELGCKGVTVYRDGSRQEQVLTHGIEEHQNDWGSLLPLPRPDVLHGFTVAKQTPIGKLFLTLNTLDGHPIELFAQIGKAGSDVTAFTESIARLVSIALRAGIDPEEIVDQLIDIGGSKSIGQGNDRIRSVPDAIGQFISQYIEGRVRPDNKLCPSCGTWNLIYEEGCSKCMACGYSEC